MKLKTLLWLVLLLPAGCGLQGGRYQGMADGDGRVLWRLDTYTGDLEACGFESGQPKCTRFPGPGNPK